MRIERSEVCNQPLYRLIPVFLSVSFSLSLSLSLSSFLTTFMMVISRSITYNWKKVTLGLSNWSYNNCALTPYFVIPCYPMLSMLSIKSVFPGNLANLWKDPDNFSLKPSPGQGEDSHQIFAQSNMIYLIVIKWLHNFS